ncbi:MAG: response regulator, partial [Proteobacteria bacterium]|nr:response regulator [Pseudomonadota bacterium]
MNTQLLVLIVEDSESDARLIARRLQRAGYDLGYERVETGEAMKTALAKQDWDLVIADYNLPRFSGPAALETLKERALDIPFIVVSATIGEENAVAMMKSGAHDYIMKDNLARLVPAVERELREAKGRRERRQADAALQKERSQAQQYLDIAGVALVALDAAGRITLINKKGCAILGYEEQEILGQNWFEVCLPPAVCKEVKKVFQQLMSGDIEPVEYYENPVLTKTGEQRIIAFHNTVV